MALSDAPRLVGWHHLRGKLLAESRERRTKVQTETIRQTVRLFGEQPEKARTKPTVEAHADVS
jgi:hypothetical protein